MTRVIALAALTALGLPGEPFHEPFHDLPTANATQRYHAPRELLHSQRRAQQSARTEQVRLPPYGLPGPGSIIPVGMKGELLSLQEAEVR